MILESKYYVQTERESTDQRRRAKKNRRTQVGQTQKERTQITAVTWEKTQRRTGANRQISSHHLLIRTSWCLQMYQVCYIDFLQEAYRE